LRQTDYGIAPISVAGGTVKVKDELKIDFDIVTRPAATTECPTQETVAVEPSPLESRNTFPSSKS
jgi:hypothetical protein